MYIIKAVLIITMLLIVNYIVGNLMLPIMKSQSQEGNPIVIGFLFWVGVFQILVIPFMYFHTKFSYLYILMIVVFLCTFGIAVYKYIKKQKVKISFKINWILAITLILILLQAIAYIFLQHSDADDSFYIAEITTILDSNQILAFDPTTGDANFLFQSQYELVGYEVLLSILCKAFQINPATFCHTLLPIVLLVVHYCVVYELCKKITKESTDIAFLVVTITNMFSGYAVYSRGAFLLFRLWQGKAVLVNIVLPILLLLFWDIFEKKCVDKRDILLMTLCTYSAFCTSAVGLYLVPLAYAAYTLTFLLYTKVLKQTLKLCLPMILALPYVGIKYCVMAQGKTVGLITEASDALDYFAILKNINGTGYMMIAWSIAIILLLSMHKDEKSYLLGVYPLVCLLTFLNPILCKLVAKYITGTSVYWRLFWSLQFTFTFVAAFAVVWDKWKYKKGFTILAIIVTIGCGKWIYTPENYVLAENFEKISHTTKNIVDTLSVENQKNCRLMMPLEYAAEVRQYTGKVQLVWSRYSKTEYRLNDDFESFQALEDVYNRLYIEQNYDTNIIDSLEAFNVDYLALYSGANNITLQENYQCVYSDENISVFDMRKNK